MVGDVLDIPLVDGSFTCVIDAGTFQHLSPEKYQIYVSEIVRVLEHNGYYINISLASSTKQFLGFTPQNSGINYFEKFNVHYHLFNEDSIHNIFHHYFHIINQKTYTYESQSDPADEIDLIVTVMQKK